MADTGIFATTAEVQRKAGANASAVSNTEAYINQYMTEAESLINSTLRINFSDSYATLNVDVRGILKMAASAYAAMMVIQFDMSGFTSRLEAQTMLDVLNNQYTTAIAQLKDQAMKGFIQNA